MTNAESIRKKTRQPAPPAAPAVLTVREAAALLRVTETTVYASARDGTLPALRVRGRVLIPRERLERLIAGDTDGAGR